MSRRRVATAVAASIVGAGLLPLAMSMANAAAPACPVWTDPAGDSGPFALSGTPAANDKLDIVKSEVVNTPTEVRAVVTLAGLGTTAATPLNGESLELDFNLNGKASYFSASREPNAPNLPNPGVPVNYDFTAAYLSVDSNDVDAKATYDPAAKTITIVAKPADVSTALGGPVASAVFDAFDTKLFNATLGLGYPEYDDAPAPTTLKLTGQCVGSVVTTGGTGTPTATASPTATATASATPTATASATPTATASATPTPTATTAPASVLKNSGAVSSQYGDAATVAAKLTNASGAALAGKTVTFTLAGKSASAKTNSSGVATAKLALTSNASTQTLVESFAGDSSAAKASASVKYTIVVEKTKITLAVAKSGTARTVTASLLDDDNHALVKQKLVVYVNGAKKATLTTDSKGHAVYKAAKGQTVKFVFAAVSGKYAASSVQLKLA